MNDFALDLSTGYCYATAKTAEDEVKQGKSYYQAAMWQFYQILYLSNIVDILTDNIVDSKSRQIAKLINELVPALSLVACPTIAAIKQGHYEASMKQIDKLTSVVPFRVNFLPRELKHRTISFYSYLAENIGNFTRVGMISAVATLALYNPYSAATIMGPVLYEALDSHGLVPLRISRCVERNMPIVTTLAFITGGTLFNRLYTICSVANYYTSLNQRTHQAIDFLAHRCMTIAGPTLLEIDAPLHGSSDFTHSDIITLLNGKDSDFELNYAHCSKFAFRGMRFEKSLEFDKFLQLFNEIDWKQNALLLKKALSDDERFLDYLMKKFPERDVFDNAGFFLSGIQDADQIREDYIKYQLTSFIKILNGKKRVKGRLKDLEESVENFSIILAYVSKLDSRKHLEKIEKEDILMKLAIDCGKNCARGMQASAQEIVEGIITKRLKLDPSAPIDSKMYILRLLNALQKLRENILNSTYLKMLEKSLSALKNGPSVVVNNDKQTIDAICVETAQNLTLIDQNRKTLALGFFPLTKFQRDNFDITDFISWSSPFLRHIRTYMYGAYINQMDSAIKEIGEQHASNYLMDMLGKNKFINAKQMEVIFEIFSTRNNGKWSLDETYHRFHRLIFVNMGVLRIRKDVQRQMDDEWTVLSDEWTDHASAKSKTAAAASSLQADQKERSDYDSKDEDWTIVNHLDGLDAKKNS